MAGRVEPHVDIRDIYRREFTVASSLLIAGTEQDFEDALTPQQVDLEEGDWITLDSNDEAIKTPATGPGLAFVVWGAGTRYDLRSTGQVTVIAGPYVAATTKFNATNVTGATGIGAALAAKSGVLDLAVSGDVVVARLERGPHKTNTEFPNGFIRYSTYNVGHVVP